MSFAPVVRYDSLRVIIAIAAHRDLELIQLDVTAAFINGVIDELVYIAQPEGYVVTGRESEVATPFLSLPEKRALIEEKKNLSLVFSTVRLEVCKAFMANTLKEKYSLVFILFIH